MSTPPPEQQQPQPPVRVRVEKRTNPLGVLMFVVCFFLAFGAFFHGSLFWGGFLILGGLGFLGVTEDAE